MVVIDAVPNFNTSIGFATVNVYGSNLRNFSQLARAAHVLQLHFDFSLLFFLKVSPYSH